MEKLIMLLMVPLMALSWLAGPVGGIWLIVRGEWWAIGYAALSLIVSPFIISIALLPSLALAAPAAIAGDRRPRLSVALGVPALAYTAVVMTAWCVGVLLFFLSRSTDSNWLPLSLLAITVGMGPWTYMASKEAQADRGAGSDGSAIATMFMTAAYLVVLVLIALDQTRPVRDLWIGFAAVMGAWVWFAAWFASRRLAGAL